MKAADLGGPHKLETVQELEAVLKKRYVKNGHRVNSVWLGYKDLYPAIQIMIRDDLATLSYFPEEKVAGFVSEGYLENLDPDETTEFCFDTIKQVQQVPNYLIVSFEDALRAAREFFHSADLPQSIRWLKL